MSTLKVDTLQTTGGAGLYPARAWVNLNGSGTVAIRQSGNVSSVVDLGLYNYRINFATSIVDADYAVGAAYTTILQTNNQAYVTPSISNLLATSFDFVGLGSPLGDPTTITLIVTR